MVQTPRILDKTSIIPAIRSPSFAGFVLVVCLVVCQMLFGLVQSNSTPVDSALVYVEAQLAKPGVTLWNVTAAQDEGGNWIVKGWHHVSDGEHHHWSYFGYQLHAYRGQWIMLPYLAPIPPEHLKDLPTIKD